MIPVILESPYGSPDPATIARNIRYLRACMRDCILRGETPYASHALYTQPGVLRDEVETERNLGIMAGFVWRLHAQRSVFYIDLGWSRGMRHGHEAALEQQVKHPEHEIVYRELGQDWDDAHHKLAERNAWDRVYVP